MLDHKELERVISLTVEHYVYSGYLTRKQYDTLVENEIDVCDLIIQIHHQFQSPVTLN
jgi:hypothetical protein